jgi:hypothetical protein
MKKILAFLLLLLALAPLAFAARGVDYNGAGNPVTISKEATGLQLISGQTLILGNGNSLTTISGTGDLAIPGAFTAGSLLVNYGNVTLTSSNIYGALNVKGAGNGVSVACGSTTITAGNILITSGNITQTAGNHTLTLGDLVLTNGNITHTAGNDTLSNGYVSIVGARLILGAVDVLSGTATARASLRGLSVQGLTGDSAPIGSLYISSGGKIYQKVADNKADADWRKVTVTDAD